MGHPVSPSHFIKAGTLTFFLMFSTGPGTILRNMGNFPNSKNCHVTSQKKRPVFMLQLQGTSVKLAYELGEITFSTGKPKLTRGEVPTFQGS